MVIKSKPLCRWVLENQHRLIQLLQQQNVRTYCSSTRLQTKKRIDEDEVPKTKVVQSFEAVSFQEFKHAPDVGQHFKANDLSVRLAAPNQLHAKPDADDLVFGKHFTDHMLKIQYHRRLGGWQKPEITPMENLVIHPAAKVFHYALELFEGMKAYRGFDGKIRIFRPDMNMKRMNLTAFRCGLPTFNGEEFVKCMTRLISIDQEWVPHTTCASLYLRPTLIGIEPTLGVAASDSALLYTILSPVGGYFKPGETSGAVSLLADPRYTRAWPGGVGDRKMGSNYGPTVHVQKEAISKGLQQVLWLYGEDHQCTEVGTMNIFMFYINDQGEQELITPPLNGLILPGITRDSILRLTESWGRFNVCEKTFTMKMVKKLAEEKRVLEIFGTGTACVVSPVDRIHYENEDIHIPTMEQEKPLFKDILSELTDIQYGKIDHPWSVAID